MAVSASASSNSPPSATGSALQTLQTSTPATPTLNATQPAAARPGKAAAGTAPPAKKPAPGTATPANKPAPGTATPANKAAVGSSPKDVIKLSGEHQDPAGNPQADPSAGDHTFLGALKKNVGNAVSIAGRAISSVAPLSNSIGIAAHLAHPLTGSAAESLSKAIGLGEVPVGLSQAYGGLKEVMKGRGWRGAADIGAGTLRTGAGLAATLGGAPGLGIIAPVLNGGAEATDGAKHVGTGMYYGDKGLQAAGWGEIGAGTMTAAGGVFNGMAQPEVGLPLLGAGAIASVPASWYAESRDQKYE